MTRPLSWWREQARAVMRELRRRRPFTGQAAQSIANAAAIGGGIPAAGGAAPVASIDVATGVIVAQF